MFDDYKSVPLITGVSLLFLVPVGIGAFAFSSLTNDRTEQAPSLANNNHSEIRGSRNSETITPIPESEYGSTVDADAGMGIPIGKYSNPPTEIESGIGMPRANYHSTSEFYPSIQENQLRQEALRNSISDYRTPSSSNSYQEFEDNSLITPLENEALLEVPGAATRNETETSPLSPVAEPLFTP
ncbi:MAG: hypothetical protein AAFQ23_08690 [Cyanobacteria bacterium J06623_1]